MTVGLRVNFVMREALFEFTRGSSVFHTSMRNKQVELTPYIYTISKLSCFGYEISVFKYTTGQFSEQPLEQPACRLLEKWMSISLS